MQLLLTAIYRSQSICGMKKGHSTPIYHNGRSDLLCQDEAKTYANERTAGGKLVSLKGRTKKEKQYMALSTVLPIRKLKKSGASDWKIPLLIK